MKRIIAFVLSLSLVLVGCGNSINTSSTETTSETVQESNTESVSEEKEDSDASVATSEAAEVVSEEAAIETPESGSAEDINFSGLNDPALLTYVENTVYEDLIDELSDGDYFVEKVDAIYLSEEYIEELAYNSKSNVFFGYTLDELEQAFQGTRYVFTLGDDGQTTVVPLEEVYDDTYDQIIKNVAVGTGVILVCVTVSVATAGVAPAVSVIFAASATTATTFALESGALSFATAAIARGYQTQDMDQALKAGALAASEGFKWGAISGAVIGGGKEALALKGATLNGLTMNEVAAIQRESKWPLEAIKSLHSTAEYNIYKKASLAPTQLADGSWALLREINWRLVDDMGHTNVQRVMAGLAPIDSTGMPYELHHIGMKADSPLAILTNAEHHSKANYSILHWADEGKNVTDAAWNAQKKEFWNAILKMAQEAM